MEFAVQLAVVLLALAFGARLGGIFLGIAGGIGLAILVFLFGLTPTPPPMDVIAIILAVITAVATMQTCGGLDYLVQLTERLLRSKPKYITIVAPIVCYLFTFLSGTSNTTYAALPVIAEVSRSIGIRPERPMSISVVAGQAALTASPVSAAMAAMVAMMVPLGVDIISILSVAIPATLIGVIAGAIVVWNRGVELVDDPVYQQRLAQGITTQSVSTLDKTFDNKTKFSVCVFLFGVALVIFLALFPELRPEQVVNGVASPISMTTTIEIIMLTIAGIMIVCCKPNLNEITKGSVFQAGLTGICVIFGLAWLGDTFVSNYLNDIKSVAGTFFTDYPWSFAIIIAIVATLLLSQAVVTRLMFPLAIAVGLTPTMMIGCWPAVGMLYIIPTYATLVNGVAFDSTGTTKIGKYLVNNSYFVPGTVQVLVSIGVSFMLAPMFI